MEIRRSPLVGQAEQPGEKCTTGLSVPPPPASRGLWDAGPCAITGPTGCRPHSPMRVPTELAARPGRPSQLSKMETLRVAASWEPSRHTQTLSRLSAQQPRVDVGPCNCGTCRAPGRATAQGQALGAPVSSQGPERAGPFKASVCLVVSGRDGTEAPEDG